MVSTIDRYTLINKIRDVWFIDPDVVDLAAEVIELRAVLLWHLTEPSLFTVLR